MMWMMGCNDGGEVETIQDPFSGRRLRPLTPRPANAGSTTTGPCLARIHGNDLLALNHHLAAMAEQGKRDLLNTQQVVVTSRWNPTPEQLQTLEELYRRGTRTPSAEQIQQITAQLRRYGKIEGKNVFYWFQNHKARERQKRRRQIDEQQQQKLQSQNTNPPENREAGGSNKPVAEVEQTRSLASPSNSSTVAEQTVSPQGEGPSRADSKADDGWLHFNEEEENTELLQLQRRNDTWQTMHMVTNNSSTIPKALGKLEPDKTQKDFITIFPDSLRGGGEAAETLELFPLRSGGARSHGEEEEEEEEDESGGALNGSSEVANPYQFFEFLPLKN